MAVVWLLLCFLCGCYCGFCVASEVVATMAAAYAAVVSFVWLYVAAVVIAAADFV
jgi:hypothetical protein